jgi:hypothetical protein
MKRFAILSILLINLSCCCCSSEGIIKGIFDFSTTQQEVSADDFFTRMMRESTEKPNEIENFQGIEVDTMSYKTYYLRYKADKEFILDLVASMPSSPSSQLDSNTVCEEAWDFESEVFYSSEYNKVGDIDFWNPNQIQEKEYYSCLKVPFSHTMLFDKESKLVYHVVEELVDW